MIQIPSEQAFAYEQQLERHQKYEVRRQGKTSELTQDFFIGFNFASTTNKKLMQS
jgi:hypothetical protein